MAFPCPPCTLSPHLVTPPHTSSLCTHHVYDLPPLPPSNPSLPPPHHTPCPSCPPNPSFSSPPQPICHVARHPLRFVSTPLPPPAYPSPPQVFPASNSARDVRDALLAAATRRGVSVRFNASVEGVVPAAAAPAAAAAAGSSSRASSDSSAGHAGAMPTPTGECGGGRGGGGGEGGHGGRHGGGGEGEVGALPCPGWVCTLGDGTTHATDRVVSAARPHHSRTEPQHNSTTAAQHHSAPPYFRALALPGSCLCPCLGSH